MWLQVTKPQETNLRGNKPGISRDVGYPLVESLIVLDRDLRDHLAVLDADRRGTGCRRDVDGRDDGPME